MRPVDTMPAITVAREAIENDTAQRLEELQPFAASVQQALAEMAALLAAAETATPARRD
jgi:hypothetical protein